MGMGSVEVKIYCCECEKDINARLTNGKEIYPHRNDLYKLPFWVCDLCGNFVGCHHKTKTPTKPLGVIPTKELKAKRQEIHKLLDPIWKMGKMRRGDCYARLTKVIGKQYHTAELKSVSEVETVLFEIKAMRNDLGMITP